MKLSLSAKIILVLQLVFAFALALTGLLNYFKYEKTVGNIISSRFVVVASGIQSDVENSLDLGLNLSDIRNLQQLIERETAADDQILAMEIFNDGGDILYATRAGEQGRKIPEEWLRTMRRSEKSIWLATTDDAYVVGATVRNSFKQISGGLTLQYSKRLLVDKTEAVRPPLLFAGAVALVLCSLVTAVGVRVVFQALFRDVRQAARRLAQLLAGEPPEAGGHTPLGQDVTAFITEVDRARQDLAAAAAASKGV